MPWRGKADGLCREPAGAPVEHSAGHVSDGGGPGRARLIDFRTDLLGPQAARGNGRTAPVPPD